MTLKDLILSRIVNDGPMKVADYMAECLMHPTLGYYTSVQPFGRAGDFVTSPEISQMFGEMVGLCLAQAWMDQGKPSPFTLLELGPGRGTLMADILRACHAVPGFVAAARISLYETSPAMRQAQNDTLQSIDFQFVDRLQALPDLPLFCVANEFFDALPIRQFVRDGAGWREKLVGQEQGHLRLGLGPQTPIHEIADRLHDTKDGDVVEIAPSSSKIVFEISNRIEKAGGAGLVIDYGDWRSLGDTLQAVKNHANADLFHEPGTCDLTAHVDFEALAAAARCRCTRMTPQGVFLERLGITQRARTLARQLMGDALKEHIAAHRRLTHPEEMGNLFKVIGLYPPRAAPPPGLDV